MDKKIIQLEVIGRCVYTTEHEFNVLKAAIESGNEAGRPFYSLRKVNNVLCETYIVK